MLVRFGFVAMSTILENASPSKTVTQKTYLKLKEDNQQNALDKVRRTAAENLDNCLRLLHHCQANHVSVYRFSSKIIPLATHPELSQWDYIAELTPQLRQIGEFIKKSNMRVTFHPDHYTLLNSPREDVFQASVVDLAHHCRLFNAMGLDSRAKLIIHVGGGYSNKEAALERFLENWGRVPRSIASRLTLENDDKTFTAEQTLYLCEKLQLPMILDLHHVRCNPGESGLLEVYQRFLASWRETGLPPKLHISSPKSDSDTRSHHDFVRPEDIAPFLSQFRKFDTDIDIMVEAKQKDRAMLRLVEQLSAIPGIEPVNVAAVRLP